MMRSIPLLAAALLTACLSQAQYVTYRFTDGSVVSHAVTDVRSTDFTGTAMRVFLWDGTTYTWDLSTLAHYQFSDISTVVTGEDHGLHPVLLYPNPTNGEVRISITSSGVDEVQVMVLDLRGGEVRLVHQGTLAAGEHQFVWDGRDTQGQQVADGSYLVRVVQGPRAATRQVIVQR
jgi:hypothetical protein